MHVTHYGRCVALLMQISLLSHLIHLSKHKSKYWSILKKQIIITFVFAFIDSGRISFVNGPCTVRKFYSADDSSILHQPLHFIQCSQKLVRSFLVSLNKECLS